MIDFLLGALLLAVVVAAWSIIISVAVIIYALIKEVKGD